MKSLTLFAELLRPMRGLALLVFVAILFSALFESMGLAMLVPLFEAMLGTGGDSQLGQLLNPVLRLVHAQGSIAAMAGFVFAVFLLKNIFSIVVEWLRSRLIYRSRQHWMERIHRRYMTMPYETFIQQKQGILVDTLITETNKGASGLVNLIQFVIDIVMVIVFYAVLLLAHVEITLLMTALGALLYICVIRLLKNYSKEVGRQEIFFQQNLHAEASENTRAVRQIRTFHLERRVIDRFNTQLESLTRLLVRWDVVRAIPRPVAEMLIILLFVGVVSWLTTHDPEQLRTLIPTLGVVVLVAQRLFTYLTNLMVHRMVVLSFRPVFDVIHQACEDGHVLETETSTAPPFTLQGAITFQNVSFHYAEKPDVFSHASFTIPYGKTTAIVGPSGSGKSTIADVLLRLYEPSSGAVIVQGTPLSTIPIGSWRKAIGFVSQENFLFHASIRDNIKVGRPDAGDEEVERVARIANAHAFICALPQGYDTMVGDAGVLLSGGQRQRIAIARALIHDPSLLIFDEATSALDKATEQEIQTEIRTLSEQTTTVIITHRPEAIAHIDVLIRIENGQVTEEAYV